MEHNSSLVNLSIPQSVTGPIVAAKIQEAVLAAMGGAEKIVEAVVHQIANQKINPKDGKPSSYSNDNTVTWIDYHVTSILQGAINEELKKQTTELASPVKDALVKQLQTKSGANKIATALLNALEGSETNLVLTFVDKTKSKSNNHW